MSAQTQGEMFRLIHRMAGDVGELKGSLTTFVKQMEVQDGRATDLEVRMRKVEEGQSSAKGAGKVMSGMVSAFVALVVTYFGGGHYK